MIRVCGGISDCNMLQTGKEILLLPQKRVYCEHFGLFTAWCALFDWDKKVLLAIEVSFTSGGIADRFCDRLESSQGLIYVVHVGGMCTAAIT